MASTTEHPVRVAPLGRGAVLALFTIGLVAVSTSGVLAAVVIGDSGDPRLGVTIAFWRCLGGALALAPFAVRARRSHPLPSGDGRRLAAAGVFLALHFALFLGSIAYTSVASAVTFATMAAVFVAVGSIRYLGEHPDRRTWVGIGVTMLGAVVIGAGDLADVDLGPRALGGDAMALLSAALVAGYLLIARRVRGHVHTTTFSSVVYGVAAGVLVVLAAVVDAPLVELSRTQWLGIAGIVVGPQLLGHTVFTTLLSSVPATVVGVVVLAEPLVATLLAWVFLEQLPAAAYWVGAPVLLAGLAVATLRPRTVSSTRGSGARRP